MGKNAIIFGADMSPSVYMDNKNKGVLILGGRPTQRLDDTTLTAEAKYPINFTQPRKRFILSLDYSRSNCLLFVNATKIYQESSLMNPKESSQEFHYYLFAVKLDRCAGSCNILNNLSNKVCVPNKTKNLNLSLFTMIAGINELETLTKHI